MGTSRRITESQLERAQAALAVRTKALTEKKLDAKKFNTDPQWRRLNARVRQISARLRVVGAIEANNAEVARLKEERQARILAEKAERKAGKKAKPEKEKGKGDAKAAKKDKPAKEKKAKEPEKKA
jgi:hypothetical protein